MTADRPDPLDLSALLASKVCHDLINPIGALTTGLEVLEEESDAELRAEAMRLIEVSAKKAVAGLAFARLAYGAGGAYGSEVSLDQARAAARELFAFVKADLDWAAAPVDTAKMVCKAVATLAVAAADCVPRGGTVRVEGDGNEIRIRAEGPKARLPEKLDRALQGEIADMEPKWAPVYIAAEIARRAGGGVSAELEPGGEGVFIRARFALAAAA